MKKIFLLTSLLIILSTGCVEKEKENPLKAEWTLDETLKPAIAFERSVKNDSYGIFYKDTQITFDEFLTYIKTLETNKFTVDWRYSDTNNIKTLEQEYTNKDKEDSKFSDGYINLRMCNKVEKEEDSYCFFMQWVDKELYNSLHKDNPTSYSFKLETEPLNVLVESNKEDVKKEEESKQEEEQKKEETPKKEEIKQEEQKNKY